MSLVSLYSLYASSNYDVEMQLFSGVRWLLRHELWHHNKLLNDCHSSNNSVCDSLLHSLIIMIVTMHLVYLTTQWTYRWIASKFQVMSTIRSVHRLQNNVIQLIKPFPNYSQTFSTCKSFHILKKKTRKTICYWIKTKYHQQFLLKWC